MASESPGALVAPGADGPRGLASPRIRLAVGLLVGAAVWWWCAHALWSSTVPGGLRLPHIDPHAFFSDAFLKRSASFDRFLEVDSLLGTLVLLAVLVGYARRGHVLVRESAAGPIGTGVLLGMLGFAIVWLAEVPFGLAAVWWERRHHISHQGYVSSVLDSFLALGGTFLFIAVALAVSMAIAKRARRWWWAFASPVFAALALLSVFVSPYLLTRTHALRDPELSAEAARLARVEHVAGTKVVVQEVSRSVTAPNAEAVGFGSPRRVVLWDTLLDGRFTHAQVRVVIAHELGHLAHKHTLRRIGWLLLYLIPATALVSLLTRRRGGMALPAAVPLAVLAYVVLQVATLPLSALVSRHEEAEADWSALQATHDPAAARALFTGLSTSSLSDPDPPTWSYVIFADHPTIAQRIAMAEAWQTQH